jgi:hypothetical protein
MRWKKMNDFLTIMNKINKVSKNIVDNVSVSVLAKTDYEATVNTVSGMLLGLLTDIALSNKVEE